MNKDHKHHTSKEYGVSRLWVTVWKGSALAATIAVLTIGMTGCALDDILMPIGGELPYEQEQTTPPEMGSVDNAPTVPNDSSVDDFDYRPL